MRVARIGAIGLLVLGVGACSDDDLGVRADDATTTTTSGEPVVIDGEVVYEASATVLESPEHGPELCLGPIAASLPPQCGGPELPGWDWAEIEGEESLNGTTWGEYHVIGTYETGVFTMTEPAGPPEAEEPSPSSDFSTACPEPDGGWTAHDPASATDEALQAAVAYAEGQPDYVGLWVDQPFEPEDVERWADGELPANYYTETILNVRFLGDLERHEQELHDFWGGPLCVTKGERTQAELRAIQSELMQQVEGALSAGADEVAGVVRLSVIVDEGLQ